MESRRVCVTGASGFIGASLVKKLLENGFTVHATLRNLEDRSKVGLLKSLPNAETKLVLFQADIYNPDEFSPAITGCEYVFHVATPLQHDSQSSKAYTRSKTLAEKVALSYNDIENAKLEVVTLACGLTGGETLVSYLTGSVLVLLSPITGNLDMYKTLKFLQELWGSILLVHVEDVCRAHIFCMEKPSMKGRFLCAALNPIIKDIAVYYKENYPESRISEEFMEDQKEAIKFDGSKLMQMGFEYKYGLSDILNDCVASARRLGVSLST